LELSRNQLLGGDSLQKKLRVKMWLDVPSINEAIDLNFLAVRLDSLRQKESRRVEEEKKEQSRKEAMEEEKLL
jgi:hypothetical protein